MGKTFLRQNEVLGFHTKTEGCPPQKKFSLSEMNPTTWNLLSEMVTFSRMEGHDVSFLRKQESR